MSKVKHLKVNMSLTFVVPGDMTIDEAMDMAKERIPQEILLSEDWANMIDSLSFAPSYDDEEAE